MNYKYIAFAVCMGLMLLSCSCAAKTDLNEAKDLDRIFTSETTSSGDFGANENLNVYEITNDEPLFSKIINQNAIDNDYRIEYNENSSTTKDFIEIETKYSDIWKTEMYCAVDAFAGELSEEDKEKFTALQAEWEKTALADLDFDNLFLTSEEYQINIGSGYSYLRISARRELYRSRTIHIKYLHYLFETSHSLSASDKDLVSLQFLYNNQ